MINIYSRPHRRRRRQYPDDVDRQSIHLKSQPIGTDFKIEYCTPVLEASADHVCAATLTRQARVSLNNKDVDYAYRWEDPVGVCNHPIDNYTGATYCKTPIKCTKNDYASWGTGTSGMNPLQSGVEDSHDNCVALSAGPPLSKSARCLPSGSDTYHLDLGYGHCITSPSADAFPLQPTTTSGDGEVRDMGNNVTRQRFNSIDLCRVEQESEGREETDEFQLQQGPDIQNQLNSMLQSMAAKT